MRVVDEAVVLERKLCFLSKLSATIAGLCMNSMIQWRGKSNEFRAEVLEGESRWVQGTREGVALEKRGKEGEG